MKDTLIIRKENHLFYALKFKDFVEGFKIFFLSVAALEQKDFQAMKTLNHLRLDLKQCCDGDLVVMVKVIFMNKLKKLKQRISGNDGKTMDKGEKRGEKHSVL